MTIRSKSRFLMGTMAVLLVCPGVAQAQFGEGAPPGSPGREIIHLTGDLYRFRDVRHYGMFLHTPEGIILVDPTNPGTAAWLKGELDSRFDVPVRYVIYSHAHNDHASGGEVFAETATFVAHDNMARNLVQPSDGAPLLPLEARSDANGNGIGDMCECGDQSGDGFMDMIDIFAIAAAIFDASADTPLCDTNDDDVCDVQDILGVSAKMFGADAYCSRHPAP